MVVLATSSKLIRRTMVSNKMQCDDSNNKSHRQVSLHNNKPHYFDNMSIYLLLWSFKVKLLLIVEFWRDPKTSHRLPRNLISASTGHQEVNNKKLLAPNDKIINYYVCFNFDVKTILIAASMTPSLPLKPFQIWETI